MLSNCIYLKFDFFFYLFYNTESVSGVYIYHHFSSWRDQMLEYINLTNTSVIVYHKSKVSATKRCHSFPKYRLWGSSIGRVFFTSSCKWLADMKVRGENIFTHTFQLSLTHTHAPPEYCPLIYRYECSYSEADVQTTALFIAMWSHYYAVGGGSGGCF